MYGFKKKMNMKTSTSFWLYPEYANCKRKASFTPCTVWLKAQKIDAINAAYKQQVQFEKKSMLNATGGKWNSRKIETMLVCERRSFAYKMGGVKKKKCCALIRYHIFTQSVMQKKKIAKRDRPADRDRAMLIFTWATNIDSDKKSRNVIIIRSTVQRWTIDISHNLAYVRIGFHETCDFFSLRLLTCLYSSSFPRLLGWFVWICVRC